MKSYYKALVQQDNLEKLVKQGTTKGVNYFDRLHEPTPKPWFYGSHLGRETIAFLCRCRSNHIDLNQSLNKIGVVDTSKCECGHDPPGSKPHSLGLPATKIPGGSKKIND